MVHKIGHSRAVPILRPAMPCNYVCVFLELSSSQFSFLLRNKSNNGIKGSKFMGRPWGQPPWMKSCRSIAAAGQAKHKLSIIFHQSSARSTCSSAAVASAKEATRPTPPRHFRQEPASHKPFDFYSSSQLKTKRSAPVEYAAEYFTLGLFAKLSYDRFIASQSFERIF